MVDNIEGLKKLGIDVEDADFDDNEELEVSDDQALSKIEVQLGIVGDEDFMDLKPFTDRTKMENGRYRFDTKVEAITHMQVDLDINEESLELCPNYSNISELMGGIPPSTLKNWWEKRDSIVKRAELMIKEISRVTTLKNHIEILRMQHSLEDRDYSKEKLKDIMIAMKTLTVQNRINETGADSVTEVRHTHQIQMVEPNRIERKK